MKSLLCMFIAYSSMSQAYTYKFCYNTKDELKVTVQADSESEAMIKAGRLCFKALTGDRYQGESKSLDIIDVCANPKRCY